MECWACHLEMSAPKTHIFSITSGTLRNIKFTMCNTHMYYMEHPKDHETHTILIPSTLGNIPQATL